ncbi:DNA primase [Niveibacterium sp. 24ML]|uniref:DNA primase n=1 Tax=Niveibacterium sp. 24ML TaxID=2985512 RepID=UPI0022715453|nr:DNA primase [Niveibacterium sp. 24ML]MCX9154564.1 DNA primase [Niveibacterium sp. 24ML]
MIPQAFIQDLIARVDIVELIQRYIPLKKAGANYSACCPFHNEKSPSFTVSPSKQFYHCFGCGAHGTAIGFLMEYSGLGFVDAVKDLAQQMGLEVPDDGPAFSGPAREQQRSLIDVMGTAARFYREQLKLNPRAIDYLKRRGLTGDIAARFGIGFAPEGWQNLDKAFPKYDEPALAEAGLVIDNDAGRRYDRFRDRIMFPIQDAKGNVIAFGGRILDAGEPKYLNSPETPLFEKGRELYGLPQARVGIRETGTVIVVEGYMDVVALAQFGVANAVATLGTATTPTHVQKLLRQADRLVFCFDGDKAGRKAARRGLEASLPHLADDKSVCFLFLPAEHDPDSYVREHGAEAFQLAARNATPLGRFLIDSMAEGCDLATAEGRAHLVHNAKEMVPKIAAPVLRLQIVRDLAQVAQLSAEETATALGLAPPPRAAKPYSPDKFGKGSFGKKPLPPPEPRVGVVPLERQLLRVLLAQPRLGDRVPHELVAQLPATDERAAVMAIIDAGEDGSLLDAPLGAWIEHFRDSSHEAAVVRAMQSIEEGYVDESKLEVSLTDLLERLELQAIEAELKTLQGLIASGRANSDAAGRLGALLAKKQKLKSGQTA